MPTRTRDIFTTIRTEGALLPPDLLRRIADGDPALEGLHPADYHLSGEKINEAVNRAWNVLLGAWKSFQTARQELPSGDLGTTMTRERWLLPLFRELDYGRLATARAIEIDGKSYPISHRWENVPIHLVSYQLDLDKRTPGVAGAAAASPHSLVQVYLNRSNELWGFVSNGLRLRILRDNVSLTRQAYVEFDLEAMMNGEVYADFVLLWLLCHQSRVEGERPSDFYLEKWMRTASQEGTRALDQLRDGVQAAIERLGEGFLAHPHNHLLRDRLQNGDLLPQDYYRQLLRMVYRLLFLFVAEDRGLLLDPHADDVARARYLDYYSTRRLRHLAERFKGTRHHDLFHGLRLVMQLLGAERNGQGRALGLPVLGSYLFSDEAVIGLIDCDISNRDLLEAIRALAFTEDRTIHALRPVDYKNLGPEELGSVYESLLELHPEINVPARTFTLTTASGHERKTTGSYYTPSSLINALLDSALNPVLEQAQRADDPEAAILNLKVCDPACGSGHFLIAAAHRMAKALASARTGEDEPAPETVRTALRDVIGHCIYGVDINPMAVELCKVGLWMEALDPGKPLSFLDHRIRCGNSLLGTTPALMAQGIPDDAFQPIEGDNRKTVSELLKRNRQERKSGQMLLFADDPVPRARYEFLTAGMQVLNSMSDETLAAVRRKEAQFHTLNSSPESLQAHRLADAWCAAFVWEKRPDAPMPMTDALFRRLSDNPESVPLGTRVHIARLADQYQFFHWHLEFPDVFNDPNAADNPQTGWNGGFDVVLGNPPWERIKIQEKEFFATRCPEIAAAPNAAARRRMIEDLKDHDPALYEAFALELRRAEGESHFVRQSRRYPLCGRGDVNTYALFAELNRHLVSSTGRVGCIVPSGIATDDTTRFYFQDLMDTQTLVSLYDFENREGLFPAVDSRMKFCLLTLTGPDRPAKRGAEFVFFALNTSDLNDDWRRFTLSAADIALINPNTRTCATFRSRRDAELTKAIYRRIPILIREPASPRLEGEGVGVRAEDNPWGIRFATMFHMSNDSHLFHTRHDLESEGFHLDGNRFVRANEVYLPLYEAKMLHQFDHRWATYTPHGDTRNLTGAEKRDPACVVLPRYWVDSREVEVRLGTWDRGWLLGWRDITNTTNERTAIFGLLPRVAAGNTTPVVLIESTNMGCVASFFTNSDTVVFDYIARQKVGGTHLTYGYLKQLPVLPPSTYTPSLLSFIVPRVLELTYTAWDLQPFAQDVGYDGPPFIWDEERRFLMRCELDALYFHLYGITRDDVDYIMETFPIVKRKDIAATASPPRPEGEGDLGGEGYYRTKHVILEMYDQMAGTALIPRPSPAVRRQDEAKFREMASRTIVQVARDLRQRQTDAEETLWECLRDRRLAGLKFRRQHPVANTNYVVDFFHYDANLIVELDGSIHYSQQDQDAERQSHLEQLGFRVIRFTNDQVTSDLEGTLAAILAASQVPEGVRAYQTWLTPPPADPSVAHDE